MKANMRAISPVVAVLLLILVAVGAAVLIYLWLTGFTGQATQTPSTLQTEFKIESARIYNDTDVGSNATIELYVRNTGRTSIDLRALAKQNGLAVYIYNSYSGDLVYSNTTLLFKNGQPRTIPDTNFADDGVEIYDNNQNGVWEPGELLIIKFRGFVNATAAGINIDNKLWLNSTTSGVVGLGCGQYYDIKVVIGGQSDVIRNVRVNCVYSNLG